MSSVQNQWVNAGKLSAQRGSRGKGALHMMRLISKPMMRTTLTVLCIVTVPGASSVAMAQSFPQAQGDAQAPLLTPQQLDRLVAPIALYPDPLLSQVLAASTYPLEIAEAQQWLQQNRNLSSQQSVEAAKQQNWDPSVQLLVAFPEVMALVTRDIRWTTDLGNAFLAQQADVMDAIQRLRSEASNNGRLRSTPQQVVSTQAQNDESAIQIQPANPQVIYPPVYNPASVWGPQVAGAYPALSYPPGYYGPPGDYGAGFGSGVDIGGLFSGILSAAGTIGSGLLGSGLGFGVWGWVLNWFTHSLFLNGSFFSGLGYHNYGGGFVGGGGFGGRAVWAHNPAHRLGVPYSHGFVAARYRGGDFGGRSGSWGSSSGRSGSWHSGGESFARLGSDGWHRPGLSGASTGAYRSGFASNGGGSRENYRGSAMASNFRGPAGVERAPQRAGSEHFNFRNSSGPQNFSVPRGSSSRSSARGFSAPRESPHFAAPHSSAPHFSAPHGSSHSGGGHSGGRHSGKGSHKH